VRRRGVFFAGTAAILACAPLSAAFEDGASSARAAAMGEAGAGDGAGPDAWLANPAALRSLDRRWAAASHTRLLGDATLPRSVLSAAFPTLKRGGFGLALSDFGNDLYRERTFSAGWAFRAAPSVSLGAAVGGYVLDVDRYGGGSAWGVDAGILGRPHPAVSWGVVLKKANAPRFSGAEDALPAATRAGFSARVARSAWLSAEAEKSRGDPFSIRVGLEAFPAAALALRAGGRTRPDRYTLGLGLLTRAGRLDYAYLTHPFLGDQHLVSLAVPW
jgi:hypothetical protein